MLRAEITAGTTHGSTSVTVDTTGQTSGVAVLISRGEWIIGMGTTSGSSTLVIAVWPLASGDLIQASYTERGSGAGIPRLVTESDTQPTGFLLPTQVEVTNADGSTTVYDVAGYFAAFGIQPAAFYDAIRAGKTRLPALYEQNPALDEPAYDLLVEQRAGQTTLTVLPKGSAPLLVGWDGAAPTANAPLTITAARNVTVKVSFDLPGSVVVTRTLTATVLPAAPVGSGVITSASYQYDGSASLTVYANAAVPLEIAIPGIMGGGYQTLTSYQPKFWQINYAGVAPGNRTATIRKIGETDPANYFTLQLPL